MYYERLRGDLFVDIDYPKDITRLIGSAAPWKAFCTLPRELKEKLAFSNHQVEHDPGYRFRSRAQGRDDKEYFHIYPEIKGYIPADGLADVVEQTPELKNFFDYSGKVYDAANAFALDIGREMGKELPELAKIIESGKMRSVLRLLHYTNDESVETIAAQHYDRSLYTLHLYESAPGLQFLNWEMEWTDAPIAHGKTVVFSGYRLEQLTKGALQKTWHRVVRKDATRDRCSMVLFVWTDAVADYDREASAQKDTPSYTRAA